MKITCFFIIAVLFYSCTQQVINEDYNWESYPSVQINNGKVISVEGRPFEAEQKFNLISDNYFFCRTTFSQSGELNFYELVNDTLQWRSLITRKGEGPLEMNSHSKVERVSDKSLALLSDGYSAKVFLLNSTKTADIANLANWNPLAVSDKLGYVNSINMIDSIHALCTLVGDHPSMFGLYNFKENTFSYVPSPYPSDEMNNTTRTFVYSGFVTKHPERNSFLYMCSSGRYMYTFDLRDSIMDNVASLYNVYPECSDTKAEVSTSASQETLMPGESVITADYIYVRLNKFKFNEREIVLENNNGYPAWFNNEIKVFDWSGNPIGSYVFDHYISSFRVDSKNEFLYATTMDPETQEITLLKYQLKPLN